MADERCTMDLIVRNARLPGNKKPVELAADKGRIAAIAESLPGGATGLSPPPDP
jgi:hypothetical protein